MRERLCGKIASLFQQKSTKKQNNFPRAVLRGNAHNVIVIKAPNDIFSEAIFLLRDEYVNSPANAKTELLRQARAAAAGYAASVSLSAGVRKGILVILTILLALETIGIFLLLV